MGKGNDESTKKITNNLHRARQIAKDHPVATTLVIGAAALGTAAALSRSSQSQSNGIFQHTKPQIPKTLVMAAVGGTAAATAYGSKDDCCPDNTNNAACSPNESGGCCDEEENSTQVEAEESCCCVM